MRKVGLVLGIAGWVLMTVTAGAAEGDRTEAVLHEQNDSGYTGLATLRDNGDGTVTLRIELDKRRKGAVHPAHLHEGSCSDAVPTIRYPVQNVANGKSVTKIPVSLDELLEENLYINIHPSPRRLSPVLACGGLNVPTDLPRTGGGWGSGAAVRPSWFALTVFIVPALVGTLTFVRRRGLGNHDSGTRE